MSASHVFATVELPPRTAYSLPISIGGHASAGGLYNVTHERGALDKVSYGCIVDLVRKNKPHVDLERTQEDLSSDEGE